MHTLPNPDEQDMLMSSKINIAESAHGTQELSNMVE